MSIGSVKAAEITKKSGSGQIQKIIFSGEEQK